METTKPAAAATPDAPAPAPVFIVPQPVSVPDENEAVKNFEAEMALRAAQRKALEEAQAAERAAEPVSAEQAKERGVDWPIKGRREVAVPQDVLDRIALLEGLPSRTPMQERELAQLKQDAGPEPATPKPVAKP
jgi:hypothetical protein